MDVHNKRDNVGQFVGRNIGKFAINIFSILHSNGESERRWSEKNFNRDKKRNRLAPEMTNAIGHLKDFIKINGGNIITLELGELYLNILRDNIEPENEELGKNNSAEEGSDSDFDY